MSRRFELRIADSLFAELDAELRAGPRDSLESERAGFLLCGVARLTDRSALLARAWRPIPVESRVTEPGYGLAWNAEFNAVILDEADALHAVPVLVHRHASGRDARLSRRDRRMGDPLIASMSRLARGRLAASVVLDDSTAAGILWRSGTAEAALGEARIVGTLIRGISPTSEPVARSRRRLHRQSLAVGPASDAALSRAKVAIVGLSGGGSHVVQQLAHQGIGTLIVIDDDIVEEENRGRLVGSHHDDDGRLKADVMERLIHSVDPTTKVLAVPCRSSHPDGIAALREADVIVTCVDRFDVRAEIDTLARRNLIPMIDIGMTLESDGERLRQANGQVVLALPGAPCLRCTPLLSDAVLEAEARTAPPGYDRNPDAPGQPQVVSMNGLLASQAANLVLALVTRYLPADLLSNGGWWQYDAIQGQLDFTALSVRRPRCPGCAEEGHGDPWFA